MTDRALRAIAIVLALPACTPTRAGPLEISAGTPFQTLALVEPDPTTTDPLERSILSVFPAAPLVLPDRPMIAALYADSPDELGWSVGLHRHVPGGQARMRCPDSVMAYDGDTWSAAKEPPPLMSAIRFTNDASDPCITGQACMVHCALLGKEIPVCGPECGPPPIIAAPAPPALPALGACPRNITETQMSLVTCTATIGPTCAADARLAIDGTCQPVGRACGADAWAPAPPGLRTIYVREVADPNPDGTRAHPLDLPRALAASLAGDAIMLSAGTHLVDRPGPYAASIFGACAATTRLIGARLMTTATATIADVELAVGEANLNGFVTVEGVLVPRATILRTDGVLTMRDAAIRTPFDVRARADLRDVELLGAEIHNRADLRASRVVFRASPSDDPGSSVLLYESSSAIFEDAWFEGPQHGKRLLVGAGDEGRDRSSAVLRRALVTSGAVAIRVDGPASLLLESSQIIGAASRALEIAGAGAVVTARDVFAAIDRSATGADDNPGLLVAELTLAPDTAVAPVVTLDRVAFRGATHVQTVYGRRASIEVHDLSILGGGVGAKIQNGQMTLERVRMQAMDFDGIQGDCDDKRYPVTLTVRDAELIGTKRAGVRLVGLPLFEESAVNATIERLRIADAQGTGIFFSDGASIADISDLSIQRVTPVTDLACLPGLCLGNGILLRTVGTGPRANLAGFEIIDVAHAGIDVSHFSAVSAERGVIRGERLIGVRYGPEDDWRDHVVDVDLDVDTPIEIVPP